MYKVPNGVPTFEKVAERSGAFLLNLSTAPNNHRSYRALWVWGQPPRFGDVSIRYHACPCLSILLISLYEHVHCEKVNGLLL